MQLRQPSPNLLGHVAPQPKVWRPEDFSGSLSHCSQELTHVDEEIVRQWWLDQALLHPTGQSTEVP
jgi:hypothetical protein